VETEEKPFCQEVERAAELRRLECSTRATSVATWGELEIWVDPGGLEITDPHAYDNGILKSATPLPEHEDDKEIIGDMIKALLEELDIEFRSLGSTTYKRQCFRGEPDQCFYIQNNHSW